MKKIIILTIFTLLITHSVRSITKLGGRDNDRPLAHAAFLIDDETIKAYKECEKSYIIIDGQLYIYDMVAKKFYERK